MSTGTPALSVPLSGWQVIEASAGTGKTWTITALIARALIERDCGADRILVMTYTRAATAELRARVRARLVSLAAALQGASVDDEFVRRYLPRIRDHAMADRRVRLALASMDQFPIQTVHGFCQRVQAQFGLAWGQSEAPAITTDTGRHVRRAALEFWQALIALRADGRAWLADLLVLLELDPDRLQPLLKQALSHPAAAARPDPADLVHVARHFIELRERAEALWRADGAGYVAAIAGEARLPATYRRHLSTWTRKVDAYFANGEAFPDTDGKAWEALSEQGLAAHLDAASIAELHPELPGTLAALRSAASGLAAFGLQLARLFRDWAPERIERYKRQAGEQEHDDAVRALWHALGEDPALAEALRRRFPVCFVDEGQDTDALQWGILSRIYARDATDTALFYVGDPKQAIYRFRGADVFTYLSVTRQVETIGRLTENRRSVQGLVTAVNALFDRRGAFAVDDIRFVPASASPASEACLIEDGARATAPFRWVWLDAEDVSGASDDADVGEHERERDGEGEGEGDDNAQQDGRSAGRTDASPRRARGASTGTRRTSSKSTMDELAARGCAAEIATLLDDARTGRIRFGVGDARAETSRHAVAQQSGEGLRSDDSADSDASSRARVHPRHVAVLVNTHWQATLVRRALQRHGIGAAERARASVCASIEAEELQRVIAAMVDPSDARLVRGAWATRLLDADAASLARSLDDFVLIRGWTEPLLAAQHRWRSDGPLPALRELLANTGVAQRLAARADGARAWTNLLHLTELLHQATPPIRSPQAAMAWFEQARQYGDDAFELRLESDADLVQIVTVHSSKGLEYPIVFVPFAWSGRPPEAGPIALDHDPERQWAPVLDFSSPRDPVVSERARVEALAETVRQLYVALTRAQYRCYLFWGPANGAEHTALAWLLHGDGEPRRAVALPGPAPMRAALEAHAACCAQSATVIDAMQLLGRAPAAATEDLASAKPLAARVLHHPVRRAWRTLSYSALLQARASRIDEPDHDQHEPHQLRPAPTVVEFGMPDAGRATTSVSASDRARVDAAGAADRWRATGPVRAGFPRGAEAGQCLHELLEQIDFEAPVDSNRCAEVLGRYGISAARAPGVAEWLDEVLDAPLQAEPEPPLRLRDVARARRLSEFGFDLSLPADRLEAFRRAIEAALPADAEPVPIVAGAQAAMMRGFVDLVFEHRGRFHIVDWKSNWLGPTPQDYRGDRLAQAMRNSSYVLQYLLYVVAVHRWLARHAPGYRYDTHFGGVWYLFLRGVSARDPGAGIFHARPPADLIAAVDAALHAGSAP